MLTALPVEQAEMIRGPVFDMIASYLEKSTYTSHQKMNSIMRSFILMLGLLMTAGCATSEVPFEGANPVPPERQYTTIADPGGVEVGIVRDLGGRGSWQSLTVAVDGLRLAKLEPGERVTVSLAPGDHRLEVWGLEYKVLTREDIVVREGIQLRYRLSVTTLGVAFIPYTQ